jgi:regulatory protein
VSQSPKPKSSPNREKPSVSLRAQALKLLARREHTRLELERKLAPNAENPGELEQLLDELTARGWLAEARVAEQVIHTRRGRFGSRRIRQELRAKGVAEEVVASVLPQLKDTEADAAREVWRRKFRAPPRNRTERARQIRFMQGRGFDMETILKVIRASESDAEEN